MTQQPPEDFHAGLAATEAKNQSARVHRKRPFRCEWIRRGSELYGRSRGRQKKATPFFDGGRVVLLGDRVNLQSPGLAGSRRLPLPRLTFIFLSHLPSLSLPVSSHQPPLCDAQRGILQLLSAYCSRTRAKHMHARAHIRNNGHDAHRHERAGLKLWPAGRRACTKIAQ